MWASSLISVRLVHSWRYTSRAVNGLASRPREPGRQQGGRHPRRVGDGRVEPAGVGGQPPGTMEDGEP